MEIIDVDSDVELCDFGDERNIDGKKQTDLVPQDISDEEKAEPYINDSFANEEVDVNSEHGNNMTDINEVRPCVGMKFDSHEEAYEFYNRYAGHMGFSIRKFSTSKSQRTNEIICRRYCCSMEGLKDVRSKPIEERKRNRCDIRTGCKAMMSIRKTNDKWIVRQVAEEHNHNLATPSKRHKLRSLRKVTEAQGQVLVNMRRAGIKTNLMMSYMGIETGGSRNIGYVERDARNFLSFKRQKELSGGDAQAVLDYFERQQMENPSFFYSIQSDSEGQMTNFFWADARSRMDYYHFGDVVCFDPTYGTNRYGMPFVPIVGVNHHYQTILFGGALLYNESEESFVWVIKTWMRAMNGKEPIVILTDQETAIGGAIQRILPRTRHRYCLWHISRNAMKHLGHVINANKSFTDDFNNCLYGNETVKEFESSWETLLKRYKLEHNTWLLKLFEKREKWASVYTRDIFCASMYTTQRSESINSYFDGYLKRSMTLWDFVKQYERAVVNRREAENDEDFETNYTMRPLRFSMEIEKQGAKVYTKVIFQRFQHELLEAISYCYRKIEELGTNSIYHVWRVGHEHVVWTVSFNCFDNDAKCSCQLFEFAGYLCRHILKVFMIVNVHNLPNQYILKRWTRDAKSGSVVNDQGEEMQSNLEETTVTIRYSKLCQEAVNIAAKGATSIETYRVAMGAFRYALKEVESAMKNANSSTAQNKKIENEHNDKPSQENLRTYSASQKLLLDPPIVKHKGRPRRLKSCLEKGRRNKGSSSVQKTQVKNKLSISEETTAATANKVPRVTRQRKEKNAINDIYQPSRPESVDFNNVMKDSMMNKTNQFVDVRQPSYQPIYHLSQNYSNAIKDHGHNSTFIDLNEFDSIEGQMINPLLGVEGDGHLNNI